MLNFIQTKTEMILKLIAALKLSK